MYVLASSSFRKARQNSKTTKCEQVIPGLLGDAMSGSSFKPNASLMPFSKTQGPEEGCAEIELIVRDTEVPSAYEENFYGGAEGPDERGTVLLSSDTSDRPNGVHREEVGDNPEVAKLKEINLQLYQHALKSILSSSKPIE